MNDLEEESPEYHIERMVKGFKEKHPGIDLTEDLMKMIKDAAQTAADMSKNKRLYDVIYLH